MVEARFCWSAQLQQSGAYRLGRAADVLEDAASELQAVITVVEATSQPMSRRDQLRGHMDTIYKYAQDKSPYKPSMVPRVCSTPCWPLPTLMSAAGCITEYLRGLRNCQPKKQRAIIQESGQESDMLSLVCRNEFK